MLLDLGRACSFLLSILSLYALIDTAFFLTATTWEQRLVASILRVLLAACISCASGLLFQHHTDPPTPLARTLPVLIFLWTIFAIVTSSLWPGSSISITSRSSGAPTLHLLALMKHFIPNGIRGVKIPAAFRDFP